MAEIDIIKSTIEAVLFSSDKPVIIDQLRNLFEDLQPSQIRALLEELKSEYEKENRGMRLVEVAGGFQMVTAPNLATFLKKFYRQKGSDKLSRPALETLAIIAYKQPVTKFEIESLRRVDTGGVIKNLKDMGIIRIAGRKKAPGSPFVYATTRQFLEYFGLKSLDELPKIDSILQSQETPAEAAAGEGSAEAAAPAPAAADAQGSSGGREDESQKVTQ
jgi:segregation and condensation protein B